MQAINKEKKHKMNPYIYENGGLVEVKDYSERVFCGYYAACGFNGDCAGDLYAVFSGPILVAAYHKNGKRINVGKELAGMRSRHCTVWYTDYEFRRK